MELGALRVGSYIIIDGEPCRIMNYTKSKPGKHGSAKARIVAVGVFDEAKRTLVKPKSAQVEVPIIQKKGGQVISLLPTAIQIMDLETYEIFEAPIPEEKIRSKLASGIEIEYWRILGRTRIMRTKG
jgi:translation initiation factor 5A